MTPKDELQRRIKNLQKMMGKNNCDAVLIMQNIDLYYFSGTMQNAQLYIPIKGEPLLFCRKSRARAEAECPWTVVPINNYKYTPDQLSEKDIKLPERLALEFDVIPVCSYLSVKKIFPNADLIDASSWIAELRSIKSPFEIEIIRKAGKTMAEAFTYVPTMIKQGKSELSIAAQVEKVLRDHGHQGYVRVRGFNQEFFYGHFLSGPNGCLASFNDGVTAGKGMGPFFPQGPGTRIIQVNEPIYLDYVGVFNGYNIDQTRLYVIGTLPDKLKYAFNTAMDIQESIINRMKPGVIASELYDLAVNIAAKAGLAENFMGYAQERVKFVGHGVGLELDERPIIAKGFNMELEEGMIFALEPKFVIPGQGAVGIENTWMLGKDGVEKISTLPDDLVSIPY